MTSAEPGTGEEVHTSARIPGGHEVCAAAWFRVGSTLTGRQYRVVLAGDGLPARVLHIAGIAAWLQLFAAPDDALDAGFAGLVADRTAR